MTGLPLAFRSGCAATQPQSLQRPPAPTTMTHPPRRWQTLCHSVSLAVAVGESRVNIRCLPCPLLQRECAICYTYRLESEEQELERQELADNLQSATVTSPRTYPHTPTQTHPHTNTQAQTQTQHTTHNTQHTTHSTTHAHTPSFLRRRLFMSCGVPSVFLKAHLVVIRRCCPAPYA